MFKVPRNKPSRKIIYERERPKEFEKLQEMVVSEVIEHQNRCRPVLVILDSINRVDEMSLIFPDAGVIKGIDPEEEREVIDAIQSVNKMANPNALSINQKLIIPMN